MTSDIYFLGGRDLEMQEIANLLESRNVDFHDLGLSWGAAASAYVTQIAAAIAAKRTPVLIELTPDLDGPLAEQCVWIDHHGAQAGLDRPTSLEQVSQRLGITKDEFQSNRWWMLVAANDRGHIRGMQALDPPATVDEIRDVRQRDLQCQGITPDMIEKARAAVARARWVANDQLAILKIDDNRTSLAAEVMEPAWGGPGFPNLLVVGPTETAFFGEGKVVLALAERSPSPPNAWYGGSLPQFGYWGAVASALAFDPEEVAAGVLAAGESPEG